MDPYDDPLSAGLPAQFEGIPQGFSPLAAERTLVPLADDTGGGFAEVEIGQNLENVLTSVVAELHSQYSLGFEPATRDGKVHEIDVRVKGRTVRARKQYIAPKE